LKEVFELRWEFDFFERSVEIEVNQDPESRLFDTKRTRWKDRDWK
jgi:hypothetical protein